MHSEVTDDSPCVARKRHDLDEGTVELSGTPFQLLGAGSSADERVVTQIFSWNQIVLWLRQVDELYKAA
jgi:hypothetical protein